MDKVFLDANVLFAAAFRGDDELRRIWELSSAMLMTSSTAAEEARRSVRARAPRCASTLDGLLSSLITVDAVRAGFLPPSPELPETGRPILLAAIDAKATHLLTGDHRHFGRYRNQMVHGVRILTPADYLQAKRRR